ncbi:MAG: RNA polymerase sigma-70 factor [Marinifilaceae bacterium]|jgi:RNA polymerase sigma-70 factor (ECF subfamily)|nr:RNA polymerase sigma-70 factor [Marinifilaceae bacterium]
MQEAKSTYIIINRDKDSFRLLYEKHHDELFRFAESYVCCPGIAEDIIQEVFIRIWEDKNLKIRNSLRSYLFTMTRNRCLNYLRSMKIEDKDNVKLTEAQIVSDTTDLNLDNNVYSEVKAAVSELPSQCKQIYELAIYDGLKYAEIAEELDISIDSVKVQIFRARKTLRKKLVHLKNMFSFLFLSK